MDIIFNKVKVILEDHGTKQREDADFRKSISHDRKKFQKWFLKCSSGKLIHHD